LFHQGLTRRQGIDTPLDALARWLHHSVHKSFSFTLHKYIFLLGLHVSACVKAWSDCL
jgi:hypothetical protein